MELRIREVDEGREEKKKHRHGITRKSQKQKKEQEEALPRNYTEKHGRKAHLSEPDA